ncbi:MAG: TonB-dependent receptor [Chitinophagaceae bacterium]
MRFNLLKSGVTIFALGLIPFFMLSLGLNAQDKTSLVKGIVQNDDGEPLSGVSVVIRKANDNFTSGTSTDSSGVFTFSRIPAGGPYSFAFSAVGHEPQTISGYNIKSAIILSLVINMKRSGADALDQVVVVGYGVQKRKDLTGSVGSVSTREIRDLGVTRIEQGLAGRVAGVQVKAVSGEPGSAPQIRIRGIGSISAGVGPLYVVDGFPTDNIQTLNPNDIESLDILKDASATAIYGSRGSNGVVIINTKRGRSGKPVLTFDTYYGVQRVSRIPKMKNSKEQAMYWLDGMRNKNMDDGNNVSGHPTTWRQSVPQVIMDVIEGKNTTDEDALDGILVDAPQQMYALSASGGNEMMKYALSGEYMKQDGIVINSGFERYSIRANFDAKLTDRLMIKLNLNPSFTKQSALPSTGVCCLGSGVVAAALNIHNFRPLRNSNGDYFNYDGLPDLAAVYNPLAVAMETKVLNKVTRLLANLTAEYSITNDLKFNFLIGGSVLGNKGMLFKPQRSYFFNDLPFGSDNSSQVTNWLTEYTLNYNKSIGKHVITGLAGYTVQKENGESNALSSNRYPNNLVPTLSAVSGLITNGTSNLYEWSLLSYLARVNYNYNSKYYLTASIRTDGSSRFGTENKYGVFPSVAVAWRLSEERFLKNISFLSELKLRASYGETGNNNIGNYDQYATINYETYALGGGAISGIAPGRIGNPFLTWERQKSVNAGVDASFFNRRLVISVDHFQSRNTDLLLNVNVPNNTGFSTALQNIGEVKNTGWEFVLSTVNLSGKLFDWSTDFNLSTYRNKVVRLGPKGDPIYAGNNVTMIGQPIGMFYGLLTDGIFKNQSELAKGPIFNPGAADRSRVGDIRFKDVGGPDGKPDGIINNFDRSIMGSPYPDFYYGMTNRFTYRNLSLSVSLQGSKGNVVYNLSRGGGNSGRARVRGYAFSNNYWKSEQDPGDGITPRPNDNPTGGVRLPSQAFLDKGSYMRVNNITLGYVVPAKISQKIKLHSLRFYVNATNPFIITKNTAFNPDASMNDNPLSPGNESSDYPLPSSLLIGVNVSF